MIQVSWLSSRVTDILGVTPEQIGTSTGMLGIPEFGTNFVRGMVDETHPTTFAELLQLSGFDITVTLFFRDFEPHSLTYTLHDGKGHLWI